MRKALMVLATLSALLPSCGGNDGVEATGARAATVPSDNEGATAATGTTTAEEDCVDLTGEGPTFTIVMGDNFFEPSCFTASASQGISIVNEGIALHNFTMKGTMIDVDLEAGETFNGEPIAGVVAPGTYKLICKYHAEQGMVGEVTVIE